MSKPSNQPPPDEIAQGYDALAGARWEEAETLGRILIEDRRHPAGYEIKARARWEMNEADEAIALLREGTNDFPDADGLWHWLGTFLSDTGKYDDAADAFERAAGCTEATVALELFNLAVVRQRKGDNEGVLETLSRPECDDAEVPPAEWWHELQASALLELKRYDETIETADAGLEALEDHDELDDDLHDIGARLLFHKARATLAGLNDPVTARDLAVEAWQLCPPRGEPLSFIRTLDNLLSPDAKEYRLLVRCAPCDEAREEGMTGYYLTAWVVADSLDEALGFLKALEPPFVGTPESIEQHEILRPAPADPKGLVATTPRAFFSDDGDEEDEA